MRPNGRLPGASARHPALAQIPLRSDRPIHSSRPLIPGRPCRARRQGPQLRSVKTAAVPSDVFVVDFDGVICNTEPELSISGYKSAAKYWPSVFANADSTRKLGILGALARLRPVLVKGYESMVMARLLLEDPTSEGHILQQWGTMLPEVLQKWQLQPHLLCAFSDGYRNGGLLRDRHAWTHKNQLFVGVYEAMRACEYPWYVASSKAAHRISILMGSLLGIDLPPDSPRLFASLVPPEQSKVEALRTISQRPLVKESRARVHFIDDRYETVRAVRDAPELSHVIVYLAEWGYNTDIERQKARDMDGVRLLSLPDFCELLRWGIIMGVSPATHSNGSDLAGNCIAGVFADIIEAMQGMMSSESGDAVQVDDGCEPSNEEVAAGVA